MDQLDILQQLDKMLQAYEKTLSKYYARLHKQIEQLLAQYYEKYGENLSNWLKYDRLERFKKEVDKYSAETYKVVIASVEQAEQGSYTTTYMMYAYLFYMVMSENEGSFQPIDAVGVTTSAAVALAYWLLQRRKVFADELKSERMLLINVFKKHKDDYVYNIINDVHENLRAGVKPKETKKKIRQRNQSATYYGINRLREVWNASINFVQDKVYDALQKYVDVRKMWCTMKDHKVRFSHRMIDGQFADKRGLFHYMGDSAPRPKLWKTLGMNWGCRCKVLLLLGGNMPRTSKVYNYRDKAYRKAFNARLAELQQQGKTYYAAFVQARKDIQAPRRKIEGFLTYYEWYDKYGPSQA